MSPIAIIILAVAGLIGVAIAKAETRGGSTPPLLVWAFVVTSAVAVLVSCSGVIDLD